MRTRGVRSEYESGGTWDSPICIGRRGEATGTRETRRGGLGRGLYRGRPRGWGRILRRAGLPGRMRPMRMRCCIRLWRAIKESCVRLAAAAACTVRRAPCTACLPPIRASGVHVQVQVFAPAGIAQGPNGRPASRPRTSYCPPTRPPHGDQTCAPGDKLLMLSCTASRAFRRCGAPAGPRCVSASWRVK